MDDNLADEFEALVQFLYMAPVGLVQTSMDGEIAMINPISAQLLMPLSRDASLTNLFTALESVAPDLRTQAQAFAADNGTVCDAQRIQLNAGVRGVSDPQMLSLTLVKLDAQRLMAVLNDITLQVKRDKLLRQSEAWFNAVLTGISDYALARLDAQGRFEDWNSSIGRLTGFEAPALIGQPYSLLYPADATTAERVTDRLREADANGWSLDEGWRCRADGSRFWGSTMVVPLQVAAEKLGDRGLDIGTPDGDEQAYCLVVRDISDKREASEKQRLSTMCDHLTGLANRRSFFEAAELEVGRWQRSPRPLSMLMVDADHFKRVNDTHGHPAGDAVLRHLAGVLAATFRQVDVVARIGGEEFAVLLPSTDLQGAAAVAERLRQAVAAQPAAAGGELLLPITVSIGVSTMSEAVAGLDALMKQADDALYAAKRNGRNQVSAGEGVVLAARPLSGAAGQHVRAAL